MPSIPSTSLTTGALLDCGLEGEDDLPPMDLVIGLGGVWTPGECDGMSGDGPAAQNSSADVSDGFAGYVAWADSNPFVPILMAHGTDDPVCSIEVARAAADELEANGHPVELLVFEGGGHAGGMLFLDDENDAAAASADPDAAEGREVVTAIVAALSAASSRARTGRRQRRWRSRPSPTSSTSRPGRRASRSTSTSRTATARSR